VLAVVLGVEPVFSAVTALPGFRTAHNGRLVFLLLFCLAMLAGWGLDEVSRAGILARRRRGIAVAIAAAVFCAPILYMLRSGAIEVGAFGAGLKVAWGFADPPVVPYGQAPGANTVAIVRLSALLQWVVLAGAGLALVTILLRLRRPGMSRAVPVSVLVGLAVALVVGDLFRANMGFNPAIPIEHAEQPTTPALRYLQSRTPNRFAALSRQGIDQPLQPDLAMRYGLYDARGYDYPIERRYETFWRAAVAPASGVLEPTQRAAPTAAAMRGLSLLGVTDLLQYPHGDPPRLAGLRLAYSGPDARVYRNERALPRMFLVARQRTVAGAEAALEATIDRGFDPLSAAVTERRVPGVPQDGGASLSSAGAVRLVSYENERVVATARARRRSLLVLTDAYFPGWKVTVDGQPATIERVNYLLRGVVFPAGVHRIEFRYEPASWRAGRLISGLACVALAALVVVGWSRRRRPRRPGS
jgi:hypothetical protein